MQFNEYLKLCREHNKLTQEELVQALYIFDTDLFEGLDTNTVSKWERAVSQPISAKQVSIVKYFQTLSGTVLPCLEKISVLEAEELLCRNALKNLLGGSKNFILDYPSGNMNADNLDVFQLRSTDSIESLVDMNIEFDIESNHPYTQVSKENFMDWALHPDSLFYACTYKGNYLGWLFSIKLKPEVFAKIINFEMRKEALSTDDLAAHDEEGCNFLLSFFAMNNKVATMTIVRYYAHLIANQKHITHVGRYSTLLESEKKKPLLKLPVAAKHTLEDGTEILSRQQSLKNIISSENTIKILFSKQACPKE